MSENLRRLLDEAIKLELNLSEVYLNFHHVFPEDANFWLGLSNEEKNHASLLVDGEQRFLDSGQFPSEMVGISLDALVDMNSTFEGILIQDWKSPLIDRALIFNMALRLEESSGEIHFQYAMSETEHPSEALKLLQRLNSYDKDHADRIRNYMHQNGIEIKRN